MSVNLSIGAAGRREFIVAFIGLWAGAWAHAAEGGKAGADAAALCDWLRNCAACLFPDLTALRRLGAIYLSAHPEERSRALLAHRLIADADGTIPARLLSAVARDWSNNHVAVVDGWLLARSEARLCALLHLEEGART
jgi:hypothetical protein